VPTTAQHFRDLLSALISEMKKDGRSDRRIPLRDGARQESSGLGVIYAFVWTDPAELLFEGATVKFQTAALVMEATVTLITNDRIYLLLIRDLGEIIETATIVVDQTVFLDALRRRMDDISTGRAANFNPTFAERVINNGGIGEVSLRPEGALSLSAEQRRFIGIALSGEIVWLWGPPGTGKTWTLTALAEELYSRDERTLVLSNTNKAVDQVLLALCKRVGRGHPGLLKGEFIRIGRISHPELDSDWADTVLPSKIAERLSPDQRAKIEQLREEEEDLKRKQASKTIETRLKEIAREISALQREIDEIAANLLDKAKVVGATITKTFLSPTMFSNFNAIIIDEASMVLLPACYHAAGLARTRVIVSGDFRQLPPILPTENSEIEQGMGGDVFDRAGITRSIDSDCEVKNLVMLRDQWRYPHAICDLVSNPMYGGRLRTAAQRERTSPICPDPFQKPISIIDTSDIGALAVRHLTRGSRLNLGHALVLRNLMRRLMDEDVFREPNQVGVISPYAAQAELLSSMCRDLKVDVDCGTVHRFQGDERDVIILDLTEAPGEADYLGRPLRGERASEAGPRLINVALTRARAQLIIIAHIQHFTRHAPPATMIRRHLDFMLNRFSVVPAPEILSWYPPKISHRQVEAPLDGIFDEGTFFTALDADIHQAKTSVEVFSGFLTLQRTAKLESTFRGAIARGITIRCITRPPKSGDMPPSAQAQKALTTLESWEVAVDLRHAIHQKVVLIDDHIAYFGSLNPLSGTTAARETMLRFVDKHFVAQLREALAIPGLHQEDKESGIVRENPRCPECDCHTVFHAAGFSLSKKKAYNSFWTCDSCDWRMDHRAFVRQRRSDREKTRAKTLQ
jgi:hypothetical protein